MMVFSCHEVLGCNNTHHVVFLGMYSNVIAHGMTVVSRKPVLIQ